MICERVLSILLFAIAAVAADDDRIVGGAALDIGFRNFQVAVIPNRGICGGALIAPKWVVTAAHCTVNVTESQLYVRAGSNYYYRSGLISWVSQIISHPLFVKSNTGYDICLLRLYQGFQIGGNIGIIELAKSLPPVGSEAVISGYGTLASGGSVAPLLQDATINIVDFDTCDAEYFDISLTPTMFCAASTGIDSCQGDSGGPITYNGTLCGVVSFGYGCADSKFPGVYTSVPYLYDWLTTEMESLPPAETWVQEAGILP